MADIIHRELDGADDRPGHRTRTISSSNSEEGEAAIIPASVCTSFAAAETETAGVRAATAALSRCGSADSRDSQLSNRTATSNTSTLSSHLAAEWRTMCTVAFPTDRLDRPLSPSILTSPDCVRDRETMDRVVTTTARRVAQLHSFLSSERASSGSLPVAVAGGACFRKGSSSGGEAGSNGIGSIRRMDSGGEDSVGQESTLSDDSLRREESQLTSAAVDEMKVELEGLEREFLSPMHTSSLPSSDSTDGYGCLPLALSNDIGVDGMNNVDAGEDAISDGASYCDDGASSVSSSSSARALLDMAMQEHLPAIPSLSNIARPHEYEPMTSTPNRKLKFNPYETGASPSGVAEFADDVQSFSSSTDSSLLGEDAAETPFRLKSKSLLNKFDSTMSVGSERSDDSSLCQLASPQPLPPSGWAEFLAEFAFGTHEYQVQTKISRSGREDKLHPRTVEGGLFVTASVSVVLAILLRTSNVVDVTEQQFYAVMAIIPPLVTLFETKILPHSIDETKVALSILLGGLVLERAMC